ncbi:MAG TPA: hypothetical protein VK610_09820, partial [Rhodothermales bacterium]|nr:hypothetical protein [Rhodothermales bacterium]
PAGVFHAEAAFRVENEGGAYVVSLSLPHAEAADVQAEQFGDELVVRVANQRRNVALPAFLAYYRLAGTTLEDGWLRARFTQDA